MTGYTFQQLIDFTRTSAATYVDSTGKIVTTPASRNLLTYTQEFDNGVWSKGNATVTANSTTAPDGTLTADTLTAGSGAGAGQQVYQALATIGSGSFVYSIYAKQGSGATDSNTFGVYNQTNPTNYAVLTVNYSTGVVTQTVGSGATMTDAGGGWWRIVIPFTSTATLGNSIRFFVGSNGAAETPGEFIYAWGAQLEQASAATTYTRNVGGVYPPRFDYDPVTLAAKGLLMEEQRTNTFTYSQDFNLGPWLKGVGYNSVISPDVLVAPDGTVTADAVVADSGGGTGNVILGRTVSVTSGTSYTLSFFAKAGTISWLRLYLLGYTTPGNGGAYFNLGAGTLGTVDSGYTATITPVGNGWYRCTLSFTAGATVSGEMRFWLASGDNNPSVPRNGLSSVYGWGAQLEAGSFATSYIPTVASQVTRTADQAAITGANFSEWYRQDEGTFVAEYSRYQNVQSGIATVAEVKASASGTTANRLIIASISTADPRFQNFMGGSAVQDTLNTFGVLAANTVVKTAIAYKSGDNAATRNGASPATSATTFATQAYTNLQIGQTNNSVYGGTPPFSLNGHIRSIKFYPSRLTNAQIVALTA